MTRLGKVNSRRVGGSSINLAVNLERILSLSCPTIVLVRVVSSHLLMRHDGVDFADHPVQAPPHASARRKGRIPACPLLEEQCDDGTAFVPMYWRGVSTRARIVPRFCAFFSCSCARGNGSDATRCGSGTQFSGGRPASPVVA